MGVAINFSGLGFRVWVSNFWFTPFWIEVEFLRLGLEFLISGLFIFGLRAWGLGFGIWGCVLEFLISGLILLGLGLDFCVWGWSF